MGTPINSSEIRSFAVYRRYLQSILRRKIVFPVSFLVYLTTFVIISVTCFLKIRDVNLSGAESLRHTWAKMSRSAKGIVVGVAFDHVIDDQRPKGRLDIKKSMMDWYNSIHFHPRMSGLVLTNMFDKDFRASHSTRQVNFMHMDPYTHNAFQPGTDIVNRSVYDQRFFVLEWLLQHNFFDAYEYILFTDITDVEFFNDPFRFMFNVDKIMGAPQIYVTSEHMGKHKWDWLNRWNCFSGRFNFTDGDGIFYNAGVHGGYIPHYFKFLRRMMDLERQLGKNIINSVCDMPVINKVIKDYYNESVITGFPFHSRYKFYEKNEKVYLRHK